MQIPKHTTKLINSINSTYCTYYTVYRRIEISLQLVYITDVVIPKGLRVVIPVQALCKDPNYFPDPDKFDPDRHSPENRGQIASGTFLPWGIGPRQCMGMKMAKMETKVVLYHIIKNFVVQPSEKTQVPVKINPNGFARILGGNSLVFKAR